eukprot:gene3812-biopygen2242
MLAENAARRADPCKRSGDGRRGGRAPPVPCGRRVHKWRPKCTRDPAQYSDYRIGSPLYRYDAPAGASGKHLRSLSASRARQVVML